MNLSKKGLGLTVAIFAGGWWLIAMAFSLLTGVGEITMTTVGAFHPFFSYSWGGMVVIVGEHLVFGFLTGWIFAWLYNKFST